MPATNDIQMAELRTSLEALRTQLQQLVESQLLVTYLTSLGSNDVTLSRPIPITIRRDGDEFIASFLDANISTGGEMLQIAISNLQSLIVDFIAMHEDQTDEILGPLMRQQRSALMDVVCPRSQNPTQKQPSKNSASEVVKA